MVRRRPTAVPGNYSPLDQKRENTGMARGDSRYESKRIASGPTGRLVITKLEGGPSGGAQATHWCPKPTEQYQEWACPDPGCGTTFLYEGETWRPLTTTA